MNNQPAKPLDFDGIAKSLSVIYRDDPHKLNEALDLAVAEVVKAAQSNNKPASLSIGIVMKPGRNREMIVSVDLNVKVPKPEAIKVPMFTDMRGRLYNEDPQQPKLNFEGETPSNVVPMTGRDQ